MTHKHHDDGSQPTLWALEEADAVKPQERNREPGDALATTRNDPHPAEQDELWELAFSQDNVLRALHKVESKGGAPGPDGMTTDELGPFVEANWPMIRSQLDSGRYRCQPVRRVTIPKPDVGKRELGVPTVLDRLICQALLQVLVPVLDPHFSEASFGFRPKRSAHMAVVAAKGFIEEGRDWVVDVDLDSFFDRVNHDALMARLARHVRDKRVLKLIRRYLKAGIMSEGVKIMSDMGTPQGSPLSPLLANVMLDDSAFIERALKLKVNAAKSGVAPATNRGLLGFLFFRRKGEVKVRIDPKARKAMKERVRRLTARNWGVSPSWRISVLNRYIQGWCAYFALADTPSSFAEFDKWLRRRLRQVAWKQWKKPRTKRRNLIALGIPAQKAYEWAYTSKRSWRIAGSAPLQRPCPRPTGSTWACKVLAIVTVTCGKSGEPPSAAPHARWCGRGGCLTRPYPIPRWSAAGGMESAERWLATRKGEGIVGDRSCT